MQNSATAADVRTWARENGHEVGSRGSIAAAVVEAFEAATGRKYVKA